MDRMGRPKEIFVKKRVGITPNHQLLIEQEQRRTHLSEAAIIRKALDQYFRLNDSRDQHPAGADSGSRRANDENLEGQLSFLHGLD